MADVDSKIGNDGSRRVAAKPTMSVPHAVFEFPLALADTTDYLTPDDKLFVLAHLGVPEIDPSEWKLEIAGLVEKPLIFSLDDLDRYPTKDGKDHGSHYQQLHVHGLHLVHCIPSEMNRTALEHDLDLPNDSCHSCFY